MDRESGVGNRESPVRGVTRALLVLLCIGSRIAAAQAAPSGSRFQYDLGAGMGLVRVSYCDACPSDNHVGPAIHLRGSVRVGRLLDFGAEFNESVTGGGIRLGSLLLGPTLRARTEYPAWIRLGAGLAHYPEGCDVTVGFGSAGGCGEQFVYAGGAAIGLDVPAGSKWAIGPLISYSRTFDDENARYGLWMLAVRLRRR